MDLYYINETKKKSINKPAHVGLDLHILDMFVQHNWQMSHEVTFRYSFHLVAQLLTIVEFQVQILEYTIITDG